MIKYAKNLKKILVVLLFSLTTQAFATEIKPAVLDKVRKSIVSIDSRISFSAFRNTGNIMGTGFIIDKKKGLIATNNHMISPASVATYFVSFYNGSQVEAKVLYYDLWQDFAVLIVDPQALPKDATEIAFSKETVQVNQNVFMVGNAEGQNFSFHEGYLSNLYDINHNLSQQSYIINLNGSGGASGSPLLNQKGEAIGIIYAGSKTYMVALKGEYLIYALDNLRNGKEPVRKHIGIITTTYSLDKAIKHHDLPVEIKNTYSTVHPEALNKVVMVKTVINGSPAAKYLQAGDIIAQVGGKDVAASLYVLDQAMNEVQGDNITLTIYRRDKTLSFNIPLYDVNSHKVATMLEFGGGAIFPADDFTSFLTGIPMQAVTISNVREGGALDGLPSLHFYSNSNLRRAQLLSLDDMPVTDINSVINILPKSLKRQFISFKTINNNLYVENYDGCLQTAQHQMIHDVSLDALDSNPRILRFDNKLHDWQVDVIRAE